MSIPRVNINHLEFPPTAREFARAQGWPDPGPEPKAVAGVSAPQLFVHRVVDARGKALRQSEPCGWIGMPGSARAKEELLRVMTTTAGARYGYVWANCSDGWRLAHAVQAVGEAPLPN